MDKEIQKKGNKKTIIPSRGLPSSFILLGLLNIVAIVFFIIYVLNLQYGFFSGISYEQPLYSKPTVHYYQDENISLEKILVRVFVFQPQDEVIDFSQEWQEELVSIFNNIQLAHNEQFFNLSSIEYVIYPQIITGQFNSQYYDGEGLVLQPGVDETQLNLVMAEIDQTIKDNNIFSSMNLSDYTYVVNQIFYTGSNNSDLQIGIPAGYTNENQNRNSSILFRQVLHDLGIRKQSTIIYHEILHTFGVPEGYSYEDGVPFVNDIMGAGLYRPIHINSLSYDTKKEMGL